MLLIIEALLLISAALVKDHRAAADEPFPVDMQLNSVDDDFKDCVKEMLGNLYRLKEKEIANNIFMNAWNDPEVSTKQAAESEHQAEECKKQAAGSEQKASGSNQKKSGRKLRRIRSKKNSEQQAAGSKQQASGSKQQASGSKQQASGSKQQASGSNQQASGSKQQAAGSKQQASGSNQQASGSKQQASGSNQQASGSKQQASGSNQQASGSKQQASGSKQQASGSKQQAAGSKQQASGSNQQASGSKQQASGSNQQASGSKQQASGSEQQAAEIDLKLTEDESKAIRIWTGKNTNIYGDFNEAVRSGKQKYQAKSYRWYTFHFLLTSAIRKLNIQNECVTTYRRTHSTYEKENVINTEVRFGSFASSSFDQNVISDFGNKSCFEIYTCHGAHLTKYSSHPKMCEVLIPPYETFIVEEIKEKKNNKNLWCDTVYKLRSSGIRSDLRCVIVKMINSENNFFEN